MTTCTFCLNTFTHRGISNHLNACIYKKSHDADRIRMRERERAQIEQSKIDGQIASELALIRNELGKQMSSELETIRKDLGLVKIGVDIIQTTTEIIQLDIEDVKSTTEEINSQMQKWKQAFDNYETDIRGYIACKEYKSLDIFKAHIVKIGYYPEIMDYIENGYEKSSENLSFLEKKKVDNMRTLLKDSGIM